MNAPDRRRRRAHHLVTPFLVVPLLVAAVAACGSDDGSAGRSTGTGALSAPANNGTTTTVDSSTREVGTTRQPTLGTASDGSSGPAPSPSDDRPGITSSSASSASGASTASSAASTSSVVAGVLVTTTTTTTTTAPTTTTLTTTTLATTTLATTTLATTTTTAPTTTAPTTTTVRVIPLPANPCTLLGAAELDAVLAGAVADPPRRSPGMVTCNWNSASGQLTLDVLDLAAMGMPTVPVVSQFPRSSKPEHIDGLGDDAAIAKVGPGPNLVVVIGTLQVQFALVESGAWPAKKEALLAAGHAVVDPL